MEVLASETGVYDVIVQVADAIDDTEEGVQR